MHTPLPKTTNVTFELAHRALAEIHPAVYCASDVSSALALRHRIEDTDDYEAQSAYEGKVCFIPSDRLDGVGKSAAAETEMQGVLLVIAMSAVLPDEAQERLANAVLDAYCEAAGGFLPPEAREWLRREYGFEPPEIGGED